MQYDHSRRTIESLFQNVFGPFICMGRENEMYETVQAIGAFTGYANLAILSNGHGTSLEKS